ncbi:ATP synthase subunit C [Entomospira culicis]|uniref:ATPase n=1 Tax=Entomospira culicis TaxID=2719989 RepID=A0A968KYT8_9SPIO|nr:ATP synthase subunit C [Entomospira culicis]NIZ18430.1 ATPase [Entomospira culicis]NIZ68646.1 ATPase [Entomospira culicis]WDI37246.1 ATP synthase subunit C [Entomospira culicis]WDI38874.1 ATP synthase subunit C [Entomospira culicis]
MDGAQKKFAWITGASFIALVLAMATVLMVFGGQKVHAQEATPTQQEVAAPKAANGMGLLGAGIAFGLAALGAGIAIASVGAAALGVISEKPKMLGQAFIFVALGEGVVIMGFAMAFVIMLNG